MLQTKYITYKHRGYWQEHFQRLYFPEVGLSERDQFKTHEYYLNNLCRELNVLNILAVVLTDLKKEEIKTFHA